MRKRLLVLLVAFVLIWSGVSRVRAEECDNYGSLNEASVIRCSDQLEIILGKYSRANNYNRQQLLGWQNQIKSLQKRVGELEAGVFERRVKIGVRETLLAARVKRDYIRKRDQPLLLVLFAADSAGQFFKDLAYREKLAQDDRDLIASIAGEIKTLSDLTTSLNGQKGRLAKQAEWLAGEVKKAEAFITVLESKKAALDARQRQLLDEKLAGLNIPRSAHTLQGGCVDDRNIDPGFSSRIAFFTFGVPNRVGMNQYGAKGRAEAGQDYEAILRAYYNFDGYKDFDTNTKISVNNGNKINSGNIIWSGNLEDYIKRIYEVPGDWPIQVLRAQAIAARSYVLAATNNGSGSICANEYCQVFKTNPKGGAWEQATNDTVGKVMVQGGSPIKAWFSSTHGGYIFKSGEIGWNYTSWTKHAVDTNSGSVGGFGDLFSNAYDRGSPWFYCDWGFRKDYNKTAWLKPQEVADIVNVILLARKDSSTRKHLYQTDKPNPEGTDNWDAGRVKQELSSRGGIPVDSVSDVGVGVDWGGGRTTTVTIAGNSFDGAEFKDFFNLRAPANIQIVGPLFNIERK